MRLITDSPDPYARRFKVPKWNVHPTVLEVHQLFRVLPEFQGWDKARHEAASRDYGAYARDYDRMWREAVDRYLSLYGDGNGTLICAVYRDHWPEYVKHHLRVLAYGATAFRDKSRTHWRAAGRSLATWRALEVA